ncbi:hypothetical protein JOD24_000590 [Kroppenstedtia sanguinis]
MELGLLLNWKMGGGRESFAAKGLYGYRALQSRWQGCATGTTI